MSLINLTGVAARTVGFAIGGILFALAFLPKLTAVLLSVPGSVMGAFLLIIMGLLFVEGIRTVVQDGLDPQRGLVVGVALALGVALGNGSVLRDVLGETWSASLGNGMTVGVLATILMTAFLELTGSAAPAAGGGTGHAGAPADSTPSCASLPAGCNGTARRRTGCALPVRRH